MTMQVDPTSLLIGAIVGAVVAFILRLHVLKKLDLKLDKLGIGLGIEGFDKEEPRSGVNIGDVQGGISGDIAGRDMHKNSNFYKMLQAATREALVRTDRPGGLMLQRSVRIESRTDDPSLVSQLTEIQRSQGKWIDDYYALYMSTEQFRGDIGQRVQELKEKGWRVSTVRPLDNIRDGLLAELIAEKEF
jgi:hypothetical protein